VTPAVEVALAALIVTMVAHVSASVWWASRITTMVTRHDEDLREFRHMAGDAMASPAGRALGVEIAHLAARITALDTKGA